MANIVLQKAAHKLKIDDQFAFDSSGISSEEQGNPMDSRAVRALQLRGYSVKDPLIARHRARQISAAEAQSSALLIPMTSAHAHALISRFGADPARVKMWRFFENPEKYDPQMSPDLADPWYGGPDDFELALDQLELSAPAILKSVLQ